MTKKIIFPLLLATSLLIGGCSLPNKQAQETTLSQPAMDAALAEALSAIEDPLVRQHLTKQFQVRAYRTTSDSSGRGQLVTTDVVIDTDTPRFRTSVSGGDGPVSDMIIIGDTTYIKDVSDGSWWKQTVKPEETEESNISRPEDFASDFEEKRANVTYTSLGTEACGGLTCHKYQEQLAGQEGVRTFWFDDQDFLLRREELTYGEFTTVNEYFYQDIDVSAPSPTKDVPEGRSVYEYMNLGGSAPGALPAGSEYPDPEALQQIYDQYAY